MLVNLNACKDIPFKTDPKFKPIYARFQFVDESTFLTKEMPQQSVCKFNQKHVFFIGETDATQMKELLATKLVKVFLHDCDEYVKDGAEATFPIGQAQFTFKDFLRPFCRELRLRSDVFPLKKEIIDTTNQLDLNTTARRNDKIIDKFSPYMQHLTYFVLNAHLAFPIGSFSQTKDLAEAQRETAKTPSAADQS